MSTGGTITFQSRQLQERNGTTLAVAPASGYLGANTTAGADVSGFCAIAAGFA